MTISLIPSMDVISDIEYCSPLTCFYSNSLCCVLDEQGKLRILKYDLGEYLLKIFSGVPVFYYGEQEYNYKESYEFSSSWTINPQLSLIESPEYLSRASESCSFFEVENYTINVIGIDDYDISWQITNKKTKERKELNYDSLAVIFNERVYVRNYAEVIALDNSFVQRWQLKCKNSQATGFRRSRFFADSYLIYVSFREEPSSKKPWPGDTVNVVCLDTGNIIWSYTFDNPVMSVMHHNNSIVVGTDVHGFILDAATGDMTLQFASPYNIMDMKPVYIDGDYQGQIRSESRLWTDGHYLYFTGSSGNQLHIYTMDGCLFSGPHQIPQGYRFEAKKQCFYLNGKSYIPVSTDDQAFNLVDFGVVIIDPLSLTPETSITLEAGPERALVHQVHDKKTESYQLKMTVDEAAGNARDDLIRYAEIEVKRIAARFGDQRWTNKEKNKKFNGQIQLTITGSAVMKQTCQKMLDILVERVHLWAKESDIDAGNRKESIKVTWEWLTK
ncbi:hypothetical protein [Shewanella japonica]|uniref:Uncharacterized protein n=1 Tax=Shewanella japonica TaxID=93973 RepID=A0ABM6JQW5_9GAMM|nr:hypothetical protein [Shewanella japonica]ARD24140.1 hypothetical protein SJ2017_3911 [Shewanella japonica]